MLVVETGGIMLVRDTEDVTEEQCNALLEAKIMNLQNVTCKHLKIERFSLFCM